MVHGFKLKRIEPTILEELEEDMIFIRGNVEVIESDEIPLIAKKESKDL